MTLSETARALAEGRTSSRKLLEQALARIDEASGEGARAFIHVYRDSARVAADAGDRLRARGIVPSPLAGVPVSIKDLFDVAGEVTLAGSRVRADASPAGEDAVVVRRLRAAGAIVVGRTNMSEFAFSGLGINPHYGTPRSPWDRRTGRVPGGSSSGAAVSVSDGMCVIGLGSDTGGSVRIPAAFCGLVGFKPTVGRIPTDGAFPLSTTLDSIGPIAGSVACCALLDAILAGEPPQVPKALPLPGLRLGIVRKFVLDRLDAQVSRSYASALSRLSAAGARLVDIPFSELGEIPEINARGTISHAEVYALHRELISRRGGEYDPRISRRILEGANMLASDYVEILWRRSGLIERARVTMEPFDALVWPTVAVEPPKIAPLEDDEEDYVRTNSAVLRNASLVNFLGGCALSVPCHAPGEAPVGLMLVGSTGADRHILQAGLALEPVLRI